jgi:hypothetical protein
VIARLLRAPLLHFFALGALLLAARTLLPGTAEVIQVSAADISRLRSEWIGETRRVPAAGELEAQLRQYADEEILVREALRLGLDRSDPVVRSRLVLNMRFLQPQARGDEAALFAQALALGMPRSDVLVRRRLVQAMHEQLAAGVSVADDEVREFMQRHPQRYAALPRISFEQVFVSSDRHRERLEAAASEVGAQLQSGAPAAGEPFLLGSRFEGVSESDITRAFGADFARAAMAAPAGQWQGPLRSPYGLHFVRTQPAPAPADLPETQARAARYALLHEREQQAVDEALRSLRRRYPVEVAERAS